MGVSPHFGWGTPQFRVASQYAFLNSGLSMSLWSTLLIGRDSFLWSVEMFEVFEVSFRILKVLCFKSFIFLSHNVLSLYVKPQVQQTVTVTNQVSVLSFKLLTIQAIQ